MKAQIREITQSDAAAFAQLHGAASLAYLLTSLLGLVLVIASGE